MNSVTYFFMSFVSLVWRILSDLTCAVLTDVYVPTWSKI